MAALRSLGSALAWRARPVVAHSFRQSQRNHRLTPSDDELLQKTTVHHLERESPNIIFIENYTNYGFSISGNTVVGPCAILPQAILQWNRSCSPSKAVFLSLGLLRSMDFNMPAVLGDGSPHVFQVVGTYKDIIADSLVLFYMLEPKIEIVVLGTGAKVERLNPDVLKCLQQRGIAVEVQSTPNACATFNFLVSERRVTAAGLIPPPPSAMSE